MEKGKCHIGAAVNATSRKFHRSLERVASEKTPGSLTESIPGLSTTFTPMGKSRCTRGILKKRWGSAAPPSQGFSS